MRSRWLIVLIGLAVLGGCAGGTTPAPTSSDATASTSAAASAAPSDVPGSSPAPATTVAPLAFREYDVPAGTHPHDVAPAADGGVWYTAQHRGALGWLDPLTGDTREIPLGAGSAPHGVIVGPDGAPWITDSGLNAIVRVDPETDEVIGFPLPRSHPDANLNTAAFDGDGVLWFTGQEGTYGRLNLDLGRVEAYDAPYGRGPYGIAATPDGEVWFVSLAGSYLAKVDRATGASVETFEPPTPNAGTRRVWSDSRGRLWVAEWNAGQVGMYDPASGEWHEWRLPGSAPQAYAVYVDDRDIVWLTDFGGNAIVRFDPTTEVFTPLPMPDANSTVRQLLGRPGEVWGAESGLDRLVVVTGG